MNTVPPAGWEGEWASRLPELSSEPRPSCAEACVFLLVGGDSSMPGDRPAPAALWLSQPSWASSIAGRLGMAGKQVQAFGPPPPRPGCGVGPRRAEVPTAQLLHSLPNAPGPGSVSQQERVGRDSSCPGSRPHMRTRATPQAPNSDIYLPPGQLPVALQPSRALHGGRASGINHRRPCLSQAEPGAARSASIH